MGQYDISHNFELLKSVNTVKKHESPVVFAPFNSFLALFYSSVKHFRQGSDHCRPLVGHFGQARQAKAEKKAATRIKSRLFADFR